MVNKIKKRFGIIPITAVLILCLVVVGSAKEISKGTPVIKGNVIKEPIEVHIAPAPILDIQPAVIQVIEPEIKLDSASQISSEETFVPQMNWDAFSNGGSVNGSSTDYLLSGTINQSSVGVGNTGTLRLDAGFWQDFSNLNGTCCDVPGDANSDATENIGDAVFLISYVFRNGAGPNCYDEGDANGDCNVNVADAVRIIYYHFNDNPPPICGCTK